MEQDFFIQNRRNTARLLKRGLVLLHSGVKKKVSTQENYDFRPNKMHYYLTGLSTPNIVLLLIIKEGKARELLFTPEISPVKEAWEGKQLDQKTAIARSGINNVYGLQELKSVWYYLLKEERDLPIWVNTKDGQLPELLSEYCLNFDFERIECLHAPLSSLRSVKDEREIEKLGAVSRLANVGIHEVMRHARPGVYEYQLEAIHDYMMKSSGLKPGQYKTILAAGKNATILHYLDNDCVIGEQELILIDIDVELEQYHCDCTRVFPANGRFSARQREVYSAVLQVQKEVISFVRPGITFGEADEYAKSLLTKACAKLGLLHGEKRLEDYYFHRIGHTIGLDTHDVGELEAGTVLSQGMVLTIEPGLYIPEENIGVRIEDMIALTEQGKLNLTEHIIKEIEDIEKWMKEKGSVLNDGCTK